MCIEKNPLTYAATLLYLSCMKAGERTQVDISNVDRVTEVTSEMYSNL
jgi:transcription initiation factor TFIIIB Brf1 subunit/transcription initiation factor TFIIB